MVLAFMIVAFIALCILCLKANHNKNRHDSSRTEPDDDERYF